MERHTLEAFVNELTKIAASQGSTIQAMKQSVEKMKKVVGNLRTPTPSPTKKLATMTKYTGPVKTAGLPARRANQMFGLPLHHGRRKNSRMYEAGPSAAQSADRSQSPIAGQTTPDVGAANAISPAYGPGGV